MLELKNDLISLGIFDAICCRYAAKGRVLKISQCAITVMMEKKGNSLYNLLGEIVTGAVVVLSSELDSNTRLWHMWFGHMSEVDMIKLDERGFSKSQKT